MIMPDNSQFTEEQRTEAYRMESIQLLMRQTNAVETIRTIMVVWVILTVLGGLLLMAASAGSSGY